jgi:hypothetical protein
MSNEELGRAVLELATDSGLLDKGIDDAKDKAGELEKSFTNAADMIKQAFAAIGIGMSLNEVLKATIEAERESVLLAAAVRATGQAAGYTTEQLKAQQVVLQQSTGIGDEAISNMQRTLMTFRNVHGEVFRSAIQLSLDFAAATGGDAADAARKFGMALNDPINNMGLLKRAGVSLSDTLKAQVESLVQNGDLVGAQTLLINELSKAYGGAAIASRDTLGGAITALKENFGNLFLEQEGAGKQLRIFIELVNQSLPTVAAVFSAVFAAVKTQIEGVVSNLFYLGQGLNNLIHGELDAAMGSFGEIVNPIKLMATSVADGTLAFQAAGAAMRDNTAAANELAGTAPVTAGVVAQSAAEMKAALDAVSYKKLMEEEKQWFAQIDADAKKQNTINAKRIADDKAANQKRIADWGATLNAISTLSQSHNKTMAAIGKAAGMAQATIDTYIGVGRALALGPIVGPPLAALVLAAGLANVARIAGIQGLESGGPMHSGQTALVGEAGPELFTAPRAGHIIPNHELGAGGSGVNVTNNISVQGLDFSHEATAERILAGIADAAKRGTENAIPAANAFSNLADTYSGRVA